MNDEECYVAKLNGILKHNCDIIRKDYSFARKYDKCLIKVGKFCFYTNVGYNSKSNKLLCNISDLMFRRKGQFSDRSTSITNIFYIKG